MSGQLELLQEEIEGLNALVETLTIENTQLQERIKQSTRVETPQIQKESEKLRQQVARLQEQLDTQQRVEKNLVEQIEALNQTVQQHKDLLRKYVAAAQTTERSALQDKARIQVLEEKASQLEVEKQRAIVISKQLEGKNVALQQDWETGQRNLITVRGELKAVKDRLEKAEQNKLPRALVLNLLKQVEDQALGFLKQEEAQRLKSICNVVAGVVAAYK